MATDEEFAELDQIIVDSEEAKSQGNNEEYERLLKLLDKKKQEIDERVAVRLTGEKDMGSAIEKQKTFEDDMRIEKDSFRLARNSSETESIQTSESSESTLSNPLLKRDSTDSFGSSMDSDQSSKRLRVDDSSSCSSLASKNFELLDLSDQNESDSEVLDLTAEDFFSTFKFKNRQFNSNLTTSALKRNHSSIVINESSSQKFESEIKNEMKIKSEKGKEKMVEYDFEIVDKKMDYSWKTEKKPVTESLQFSDDEDVIDLCSDDYLKKPSMLSLTQQTTDSLKAKWDEITSQIIDIDSPAESSQKAELEAKKKNFLVYPSKQLPKEKNPLADVQGKLDAQVGALFFGDPDGEDIQIDEEKAIENLYQTLEAANSMKEAPAPPELKISLLPHQAQGLYWLSCQEQGPHRGGILADEMGLGKTVQILSLILMNKSKNTNHKTTLVVGPLAVIHQWKNEIEEKTLNGSLRVLIYHGPTRTKNPRHLLEYDLVITTYAILASEYPRARLNNKGEPLPPQPPGPLFQVNFFRIVLDEAQAIKNKGTKCSLAATGLRGERRWCLSGTPIQNELDDIYSQYRFLKIEPYCNYKYWKQHVAPGKRVSLRGVRKLQTVIRGTLLRRRKTQIGGWKPIIEELNVSEFSLAERDVYNALEQQAIIKFNAYLRAGTVMQNYTNVLVLLLQLRQACNHPKLVRTVQESAQHQTRNGELNIDKDVAPVVESDGKTVITSIPISESEGSDKDITQDQDQDQDKLHLPVETLKRIEGDIGEEQECPVCFDLAADPVVTQCGHFFCNQCITDYLKSQNSENTCPICRADLSEEAFVTLRDVKKDLAKINEGNSSSSSSGDEEKEVVIANNLSDPEKWVSSTKVNMLMRKIVEIFNNSPDEKIIIFSQWTTMLSMIETPFEMAGYKFRRYDGQMTVTQREEALYDFRKDTEVKLLLMSLKCGGLGLNLTCASRVFLIDLWWNPALEEQAIGRCHRIGQQRDVQVVRLTIKQTVEDRILRLQERKKAVADGALGEGSLDNMRRLSLNDLIFLFKGGETREANNNVDPTQNPVFVAPPSMTLENAVNILTGANNV